VKRVGGMIRAVRIDVADSRDKDTEVTSRVENITVRGNHSMEISILGKRFRCDQNTEFIDPDGQPRCRDL